MNELDILESNYKDKTVVALRKIGTNIDSTNPTFEELCNAIVNSQNINSIHTGAIENNLPLNTAAWVNGKYVIGNGKDIETSYNNGYNDGYEKGYEDGYNKGVDDTLADNAVQITRHIHVNSCMCSGNIVCYNSSEFSGNAYHGMTYYYRCSLCSYTCSYSSTTHHFWDSDGDQHFHDPVYSGTYPVPTKCPNQTCGKTENVSIDAIKVNGITYNIKDGTIIES